jgi:hypothetical protein
MSVDQYLEKIVADGYKQQIADEENVPRSLPFFATSLAVLVAILGVVRSSIPPMSLSWFPIAIWSLLGLLAISLLLVIYFLWRAVHKRDFKYVMSEVDLFAYAANLKQYYELDQNLMPDEREDAIIEDVRSELIKQYRDAATNNRFNNFQRGSARATALSSLVSVMLFAFVMIALILIHERFAGEIHGCRVEDKDRGSSQAEIASRLTGPRAPQAGSAVHSNDHEGRVDVSPAPAAP